MAVPTFQIVSHSSTANWICVNCWAEASLRRQKNTRWGIIEAGGLRSTNRWPCCSALSSEAAVGAAASPAPHFLFSFHRFPGAKTQWRSLSDLAARIKEEHLDKPQWRSLLCAWPKTLKCRWVNFSYQMAGIIKGMCVPNKAVKAFIHKIYFAQSITAFQHFGDQHILWGFAS